MGDDNEPIAPPVRACSCRFKMDALVVISDIHPEGDVTYICGHCDKGECPDKKCARCRMLTQADAHNQR